MSASIVFCFFAYTVHVVLCDTSNATVYCQSGSCNLIVEGLHCEDDHAIACGYFQDTLNATGWSILEIATQLNAGIQNHSDCDQMYAAGLLEGYLTANEIYYSWLNILQSRGPVFEPYMDNLTAWTQTQREWTLQQIELHNDANDAEYAYWQYANALMGQLQGVVDGYNLGALTQDLPALQSFDFWFLNTLEEFNDLLHVFDPDKFNPDFEHMSPSEIVQYALERGSCSAIVKVTPTLDDIFFSHSTWTDYYRMNRVYKYYKFQLNGHAVESHQLSMSAAPAILSSIDDYYIMDSGLAVMETTNEIYNNSLWSYLTPKSMYVWQRAMISNALTNNGEDWARMFEQHNSGTYNNQWMVLDYKRFTPNQPLSDGLLYVLEQIPGYCSYADVTSVLERGYWASYNVPALPDIYERSGNANVAQLAGAAKSFDLAPRARIFRRDANEANTLAELQKLMRYNDYRNDALENGDPCWSIMCRADLYTNATQRRAFGGIDTKLASFEMLWNLSSIIQSGPTYDALPFFDWVQFANVSHIGLPAKYNFDWILVNPAL